MHLKIIASICLASVFFINFIQAAPSHNIKNEQELQKRFVEFLQQDKQLAPLLQKFDHGDLAALSRTVREAEVEGNEANFSQEEQSGEEPKKDGFFDRAAKFVMEVLQRFLKWVNTEN